MAGREASTGRTGAAMEIGADSAMRRGRTQKRGARRGIALLAAAFTLAAEAGLAAFARPSDPAVARAADGTARASIEAAPAPDAHTGFVSTGSSRALKGAPGIYEWRYVARCGPSPFDRIGLHRVAFGPKLPAHPKAVMLYLPGTNMNGEIVPDDSRFSLPLYLAAHGVDVWTFDYRTHFVPPDAQPSALSEMAGWSYRLFDGDIEAAARFVSAETGRPKLFVAGFSRGASFAYLFAALHPERVAGLVILDGFISRRPSLALPPGRIADDIGGRHIIYDKRKALMEAVIRDPAGTAPLPKYKNAADNLAHVVYGAGGVFGGHGGLANPLGGFAEPAVLAAVLLSYDRWWPAVQDYENPFDARVMARLAASKLPVLAFSSTNISSGWPGEVRRAAAATGSADVGFKRLDGWGHLDVICGTHAEREV